MVQLQYSKGKDKGKAVLSSSYNELYNKIARLERRVSPEQLQLSVPPHWANLPNMPNMHDFEKVLPQRGIKPENLFLMVDKCTWTLLLWGNSDYH